MYATKVSEIENPWLHDAAYVLELQGFKLRSIHMDPDGECAISYYGCLSVEQIATVIQNFWFGDVERYKAIQMVKENNQLYEWFKDTDGGKHPNGFTQIYTPDGVDYRQWELINRYCA